MAYCRTCKTNDAYKVNTFAVGNHKTVDLCDLCPKFEVPKLDFPAIHRTASTPIVPQQAEVSEALPIPVVSGSNYGRDPIERRLLDDVDKVKQGKRCEIDAWTDRSDPFPEKKLHNMIVKQLKTSNYKIIHNKGGRVIADAD